MPSILIYALAPELRTVVTHLDDDPDVAFVVADGPRGWRTVERVGELGAGHHALWLRAHGPLPLVEGLAATSGVPFFGSDPAVVWLHVPPLDAAGEVPMSAIGWIGDRYRSEGHGASPDAGRWWQRLQRWIRARTELVRRGGPDGIGPRDVAAFPEALARLRSGVKGALNPPTP